jgi:hypothetical protein
MQFRRRSRSDQLFIFQVAAVPPDDATEPIPTSIRVAFTAVEPFDYLAGVWTNSHRLAHRYATSDLRLKLYYKCISILRESDDLPDDCDFFRVQAEIHQSDSDLFDESVSDDRWLLRATLRTSYFLSFEAPHKNVIARMTTQVQRNNIARLRRALSLASCGAQTTQATLDPTALNPYPITPWHLIFGAGCGGHREVLDVSDLETALRELIEECGSVEHIYVKSFQMARSKRSASGMVGTAQELELPYHVCKELDSFDTPKVYMVKLGDELDTVVSSLDPSSLRLTTLVPCKASSWSPHLQQLLDEADSDPAAFYASHQSGRLVFNMNSPISLTLLSNSEYIEKGGSWFLHLVNHEAAAQFANKDSVNELTDAAAALVLQDCRTLSEQMVQPTDGAEHATGSPKRDGWTDL